MSNTREVHFTVDPDGGPIVLKIEFVPAKTEHDRAMDAACASFDMDAAQARWAEWDRVLADVLGPCELPQLEPIMTND